MIQRFAIAPESPIKLLSCRLPRLCVCLISQTVGLGGKVTGGTVGALTILGSAFTVRGTSQAMNADRAVSRDQTTSLRRLVPLDSSEPADCTDRYRRVHLLTVVGARSSQLALTQFTDTFALAVGAPLLVGNARRKRLLRGGCVGRDFNHRSS